MRESIYQPRKLIGQHKSQPMQRKMIGGIKEHKSLCVVLHNCVCIYFCLVKIYLHAHFIADFRGTRRHFGSYMKTRVPMEDSQGSYSHGEEFRGIHVNIGNDETKYNGRRERKELVIMRSLQREV